MSDLVFQIMLIYQNDILVFFQTNCINAIIQYQVEGKFTEVQFSSARSASLVISFHQMVMGFDPGILQGQGQTQGMEGPYNLQRQ